MIILVDWENIGCNLKSLNGIEYLDKNDTVEIFYSASRPMIKQEELNKLLESNCNLKLTKLLTARSNALDFYICCAAGIYLSQHNFENVNIGILSGDTGFDSLTEYINKLNNCTKVKTVRDTVITQLIRYFNEPSKQKTILHINSLNKNIEIEKAYNQYIEKQKKAEGLEDKTEDCTDSTDGDFFIDLDDIEDDSWIYGGDDTDYEVNIDEEDDDLAEDFLNFNKDEDDSDFDLNGLLNGDYDDIYDLLSENNIEDEEDTLDNLFGSDDDDNDSDDEFIGLIESEEDTLEELLDSDNRLESDEVDKVFNSIFKTTSVPENTESTKTTETLSTKLIDKLPNYNLSQKEHEILNSYLEITPYTTLQKLYHDIISLYGRNRGLVIYKALKEDLKAIENEEKTSGKTESK